VRLNLRLKIQLQRSVRAGWKLVESHPVRGSLCKVCQGESRMKISGRSLKSEPSRANWGEEMPLLGAPWLRGGERGTGKSPSENTERSRGMIAKLTET